MAKFRYTQKGDLLTLAQREFYEENGYLIVKNNVTSSLLDEVKQRFVDICDGKVETGMMTVMKDQSLKKKGAKGEYLINKIQDFLFDDILFKYTSDKAVIDVVSDIIGSNITAAHSMLINKPPDSDTNASLHPMHQDLHYFPFRPADRIVASWTAIENVTAENGCLFVVPGSHKLDQLFKHDYPEEYKNSFYHGVKGFDHLPKVNVLLDKGDTVFFHPILLHGSGPNRTKGFRKAISCHYANSNCQFINVKGTTQEGLAREIEQLSRRKGLNITYAEGWQYKSRIVSGEPGQYQKFKSHL